MDETAYHHDLAYRNCGDNLECKHNADRIMLNELNNIQNPTIRERLDRLIVKPLIGTKLFLGIGINEAEQLANELHKPYRKPPILLKVKVFNPDDIWSADQKDMGRPRKRIL